MKTTEIWLTDIKIEIIALKAVGKTFLKAKL